MLKNVAIPLMLAATQAEAQTMTRAQREVEDAMEADRKHPVPEFIADQQACTDATNSAVASASGKVSQAADALVQAKNAAAAATKVAGAWTVADNARRAAVKAATDQEAAANIAALLDALDNAAELERQAAKDYLAKDTVYQNALLEEAAAQARVNAAADRPTGGATQCPTGFTSTFCTYKAASDAAAQAVVDAKAQHAKETQWREWLYCELGGAPSGAQLTNWWASSTVTGVAGGASAPLNCVVPAVTDGGATPVQLRGAVTYFNTVAGLAAEKDDGTSRWTATLKLAQAQLAEASTTWSGSTLGTINRNRKGAVAYRTGELKAATWLKMRRDKEKIFYDEVVADAGAAKAITAQWNSAIYDYPAANTQGLIDMGLTASAAQPGPAKALATAATARDANTASLKRMPSSRAQSAVSGQEWQTVWTLDAASLDAWTGNANTAAGATSLWWVAARALSTAVADWHTFYTANTATLAAGAFTETEQGTAQPCDTTTTASDWTAAAGVTTAVNCKAACENQNINNILVQLNSGAVGHNGGGRAMARWDATAAYCGGYSFLNGGVTKVCKLMQNKDTPSAITQVQAGDKCAKLNQASAMSLAQVQVNTKWTTLTASSYSLLTNMQNEMDTQAALEKAWLQAWYLQQYWKQVNLQLDSSTAGSIAKVYGDVKTALDATGASNTANTASAYGAGYQATLATTNLDTATETLSTLQTATAAATSVVAALGARILRIEKELTDLNNLATVASGATPSGTLDQAAAKRLKDFTDYQNGEVAAATAALNAAKAKTAVTASPGYNVATDGITPPDTVYQARARALAKWNAAKLVVDNSTTGQTPGAKQALAAALGTASLATLRADVAAKTVAWNSENTALLGLLATQASAEATLKTEKAKQAKVVLDCQTKAYDAYRTTLQTNLEKREADLKTIKALIEKERSLKPAQGKAGSRCEKALSNGTWRPARTEGNPCDKDLCCGASRVWMAAGAGTKDAAWRTIETCQLATATSYMYQPARAPMALTMPTKVSVGFACIQGAKTLAAAASAVAAAVYMLA